MGKIADEDIRRWLKAFTAAPIQVKPGIVRAIDEENYTCEVEPLDGELLTEVRLKAGMDELKDGVVEMPVVGSPVLVSIIGNDLDTAVILKTSAVSKVVINGGDRPLVDWPKAKEELEKTTDLIQALVTVLQGAPILEPGNGAPSALQAALSAALAGKALGSLESTEDDKVLH